MCKFCEYCANTLDNSGYCDDCNTLVGLPKKYKICDFCKNSNRKQIYEECEVCDYINSNK